MPVNNARNIRQASLVRNEFGAVFSGPMPFLKDKLFFFLNYEGLRDSIPATSLRTNPNIAIRTGNFSGLPVTIYDPLTREPFPNNTIPAGRSPPTMIRDVHGHRIPRAFGSSAGPYRVVEKALDSLRRAFFSSGGCN